MRAAISQDQGEISDVFHELYEMLHLTATNELTFASLIIETNLLRAKSESLSVINGDAELIKIFDEITQRTNDIRSELEKIFQSRLSVSNVAATLTYTRLVATRKKAECEGDEVTLATLTSQWDEIEKILSVDKLQKTERAGWSRAVAGERARVALTPDLDKKSM
jgi:hypothetical protein